MEHDDLVPIDPEVIALMEAISKVCEDKSLAHIMEAFGIMLHRVTDGDHKLIVEGLQRIGTTAVNVCTEVVH
jgi:hypothetical protein